MIHYVHNNADSEFKRGTIAIDVPSKTFLEDQLFKTHSTGTLLNIGAARLAPNKQFVKAEGRKYALELVKPVASYLTQVEIRGTKHIYHFTAKVENKCPDEPTEQMIEFAFSTIAESSDVHIIYCIFKDESKTNNEMIYSLYGVSL